MKKKFFLSALFICFLLFMVYYFMIYPKEVIEGALKGMSLWFTSVFPSLFPFLVITGILSYLGFVEFIGTLLEPIMLPVFKISGQGAFAYISGIVSGYPVGAKVTADLRQNGSLSKNEADRLIAFANHAGPLFLLGTVGVNMFYSTAFGYGLIICHITAGFLTGIFMRFRAQVKPAKQCRKINIIKVAYYNQKAKLKHSPKLGDILGKSIISAMDISLHVGGFIIFFSVVSKILVLSGYIFTLSEPLSVMLGLNTTTCNAIIMGLIEMTNGLKMLSLSDIPINTKFILSAFLTGFGGISILLQALSLISHTDINGNMHILGKIIHGAIAAFFAYILLTFKFIRLYEEDIQEVFNILRYPNSYQITFYMLAVSLLIITAIALLHNKKNRRFRLYR